MFHIREGLNLPLNYKLLLSKMVMVWEFLLNYLDNLFLYIFINFKKLFRVKMHIQSDQNILDELRKIQKDKNNWKDNINNVAVFLNESYSVEVKAKALWIMGEMGLAYPEEVKEHIDEIAGYMENEHPKLRERSLNALGRIGRADNNLIIPYLDCLMEKRADENERVRLSFIWACENIATNAPELFCEKLDLYYEMISDSDEKVRIEAPEMFRVIGKRKPEHVKPYLEKLQYVAQNDEHPVVRIHCEGAIRITKKALKENGYSLKN